MPLKILINGAGIAGTALANFLVRSQEGHDITIVERTSKFRPGGTQLDLKSYGAPLMKRLGLLDAVRARSIHETAFTFVDTRGRDWTPGSTSYSPTGSSDEYDLVVGADGQNSLTRRILWEPKKDCDSTLRYTGYSVAYFHMPKSEEEFNSTLFKSCLRPGLKVLSLRCAHKDFTQAMLTVSTTEELKEMVQQPVEKQKDLWETTTASLVGAYVLAGDLARHGDNVGAALESYETVLRPYVERVQQLPPLNLAIFRSKLGLTIAYFVLAILSRLRMDRLVNALMKDDKETWQLPQYPELELEE
ncbi:hypothetical protein A1O3_10180 [Capronia epimyces CBS 606.96]|uniref:FAD-binding domain-containing protein n=1 Tax=Capronia epimyces CBS 606.96 TaxID=1182542 RepID=W9X9X9_9EURO|nr:uncharacterized protein A1O3_10180 [Capronia epimyces CBS 606.96]EXJ77023.1 hypothetical protein A1O3_10180 [Capronia epimyces CBS 606.96]